ncbi:MAG: DUF481 domain-containing protein [Victivallales bacterium]|nr:DUF481 domain-containing protein [Victivallales bacterium]
MLRKLIIPALFARAALCTLPADELVMKNGSRLIGDLVSAESDKVIFNTPFAGKITVKQENVERIITSEPVTLMMEDGTVYKDRQIVSTENEMHVESKDAAPVTFAADDIKIVNPEPWKLGEGYKWSGNVSLAVEFERGNSDTDEWHLKGKTVWRSLEDRYTLGGDLEDESSNGVKKEDNWSTLSKYDRFTQVGGKDYLGAKLMFKHDQFEDLDLRTIIGPHIGRQFFETSAFSLGMEIGPVWVDEQFDKADDDEWLGVLWFVEASSDIVGFGTTLYATHDGILNTSDTGDTILNAILGIKIPIIGNFETAFEVELEYDGGAVEGVDNLDETYNIRFGYSW